jgi:predicted AAA+ superfamily ATPase
MVFIGGPRQVGKTSLARSLLPSPACELNYDIRAHRQAILAHELPPGDFWFFDEIHKFRGWRNYLKGLFDEHGRHQRILVTGSARLDLYRFGGDSLQGRYFYLRLHPFSVAELGGHADAVPALLALGGFPEPFLSGSERFARRWALAYRERLVREEISSLETVSDLGRLELLATALPDRVGSPLSLNALREDLQVSHQTVSRWTDMLERVYGIFRLAPFGAPMLRAVKKERKHYHYDWSVVTAEGARFENLVASHLLKWVEFQIDTEGRPLELRYFRDVDGREVDFVVVERGKPIALIECKLGDDAVSPGLRYLKARFPGVTAWQVSARGSRDYVSGEGVRVAPAARLLRELV